MLSFIVIVTLVLCICALRYISRGRDYNDVMLEALSERFQCFVVPRSQYHRDFDLGAVRLFAIVRKGWRMPVAPSHSEDTDQKSSDGGVSTQAIAATTGSVHKKHVCFSLYLCYGADTDTDQELSCIDIDSDTVTVTNTVAQVDSNVDPKDMTFATYLCHGL